MEILKMNELTEDDEARTTNVNNTNFCSDARLGKVFVVKSPYIPGQYNIIVMSHL